MVASKVTKAFKELGRIDTLHESGKINKRQHNTRSMAVLRKLVKK